MTINLPDMRNGRKMKLDREKKLVNIVSWKMCVQHMGACQFILRWCSVQKNIWKFVTVNENCFLKWTKKKYKNTLLPVEKSKFTMSYYAGNTCVKSEHISSLYK